MVTNGRRGWCRRKIRIADGYVPSTCRKRTAAAGRSARLYRLLGRMYAGRCKIVSPTGLKAAGRDSNMLDTPWVFSGTKCHATAPELIGNRNHQVGAVPARSRRQAGSAAGRPPQSARLKASSRNGIRCMQATAAALVLANAGPGRLVVARRAPSLLKPRRSAGAMVPSHPGIAPAFCVDAPDRLNASSESVTATGCAAPSDFPDDMQRRVQQQIQRARHDAFGEFPRPVSRRTRSIRCNEIPRQSAGKVSMLEPKVHSSFFAVASRRGPGVTAHR
jgi:hypothetical protein